MSALTSVAWSRLMSAPWGRFDMLSIIEKSLALFEYEKDWKVSPNNPANAKEERCTLTNPSAK